MRPNRRAARTRVSIPTIAIIAVGCAAVAAVLIGVRGSSQEVSSEQVAAGLPQYNSGQSVTSGVSGQAASASGQPVTDTDRTFLVKVRQAGLWEIPAGRLAQTHASSEAVKRAGLHLIDGHSKLDQLVREDARLLGAQIPNQATAEQQEWVRQLENAQGQEFDRLFANLLRASHGKIFATIGEVRAATQNDLVRRLARQANVTVMDHMEVLEDTGLVDSNTLEDVGAAVAPK